MSSGPTSQYSEGVLLLCLLMSNCCCVCVVVINDSMTTVRGELFKSVSQCMAQTGDIVRSKLTELLKSKVLHAATEQCACNRTACIRCELWQDMSDMMGRSVSAQLQAILPSLLENIFKTVVLEPVERAFQGMFKQIDETFRKGTMECEFIASRICNAL